MRPPGAAGVMRSLIQARARLSPLSGWRAAWVSGQKRSTMVEGVGAGPEDTGGRRVVGAAGWAARMKLARACTMRRGGAGAVRGSLRGAHDSKNPGMKWSMQDRVGAEMAAMAAAEGSGSKSSGMSGSM